MTGILVCIIIAMTVRIVYSEFRRRDDEEALEGYRILVLEWYFYLHNKEHNEDFEMWRAELKDD